MFQGLNFLCTKSPCMRDTRIKLSSNHRASVMDFLFMWHPSLSGESRELLCRGRLHALVGAAVGGAAAAAAPVIVAELEGQLLLGLGAADAAAADGLQVVLPLLRRRVHLQHGRRGDLTREEARNTGGAGGFQVNDVICEEKLYLREEITQGEIKFRALICS